MENAKEVAPNVWILDVHWMTDPREIREAMAAGRRERARQQAEEDGISPEHWDKFADAAELTFQQVNFVMSLPGGPSRREMRKRRRALLQAAFTINEVPWLWRNLVWLGTWSGYVLPAPWNVVVPAIFYVIDLMTKQTEKAVA